MTTRIRAHITGAVQGVGYRPFVYRLATRHGLTGWVRNDGHGVIVEAEGAVAAVERVAGLLAVTSPPRAVVTGCDIERLPPAGYDRFEIRTSGEGGSPTVLMLPDVATCPDCLAEIRDPKDRRYRYPFTNCTNCGPRFSIIAGLPYDRAATTMQSFTMCHLCRAEYEDPTDRRFHAQPNACPDCGPAVAFLQRHGSGWSETGTGEEALDRAVALLRDGGIAAVQGLGGFHLMVDARNETAIAALRAAKPRPAKPLAVMAVDLDQAALLGVVDDDDADLLTSPEAPIVLLERHPDSIAASNVAPGNPTVGVMLAATPLHHVLLSDLGFPVVATSGNVTDEPIAFDPVEGVDRLGHVAGGFLVHDRPIQRHVDDSVARIALSAPRLIRRARGFAPLPIAMPQATVPILAVGAHLKNTVALNVAGMAFISQHIGDLDTVEAIDAFERVIADFIRIYDAAPEMIAHDLHPDYVSARWARDFARTADQPVRLMAVQHHHAHLAACLADNETDGPALGVTWDGIGYGPDGTIWGGEFLAGDAAGYRRIAHLRPFRLPGGDAVSRQSRRSALGLLWETLGPEAVARTDLPPVASLGTEAALAGRMLERRLNAPLTTSMGRLFDGVAALLDLHQETTFEAQAAMALEFVADPAATGSYPFPLSDDDPAILDWGPMLGAIMADHRAGVAAGVIAARFHNALVDAIVAVAQRTGLERVALTGGVFQNTLLVERAAAALRHAGFEVLLHRRVPANDGGIALGQIAVAAAAP